MKSTDKDPYKNPKIKELIDMEDGWNTFRKMSPRLFNFYNSLYLNQIKNYIWERLPSFNAITDMGWWKKWFTIKKQEAKQTEEIERAITDKANVTAQFKETQALVDRKNTEKAKDEEKRTSLQNAYAAIKLAAGSLTPPKAVTSPTSAPKPQIDTRRTSSLDELIEAKVVTRQYINKLKDASSSPIDSRKRTYARQDLAFLENGNIDNHNKKYYVTFSPSFSFEHRVGLTNMLSKLSSEPDKLNRVLRKGFETMEQELQATAKNQLNLGH